MVSSCSIHIHGQSKKWFVLRSDLNSASLGDFDAGQALIGSLYDLHCRSTIMFCKQPCFEHQTSFTLISFRTVWFIIS